MSDSDSDNIATQAQSSFTSGNNFESIQSTPGSDNHRTPTQPPTPSNGYTQPQAQSLSNMEENNLSWKVVARPQLETWSISTNHVPTVIIFGEPGVGKSSVVNLILGEDTAPTSPNAERCTFSSTSYSATIQGKMYNLYDTSRINHGGTGTANIEAAKTILDLYNLVRFLDENEGPKLLVFVVRCGRLTETTKKNYDLFRDTIFEKMVPIVVVITGCENVIPMDHWWDDNKATFEEAGMTFSGHACVCTFRGRKRQIFNSKEKRFKESKAKVEGLIRMGCHFTGQKMEPLSWFKKVFKEMNIPAPSGSPYNRLLQSSSMDQVSQAIQEITQNFVAHPKSLSLHTISKAHNPNVIVFGETGTGKSSVINLILGTYKAPISNDAMGCTFSSACYQVQIQEKIYNLYDTAGFNESATGTVSSAKAIANLYTLVRTLSDTGGVNLLVFVVRCGRLTESTKKNYDLFRDTFCQSRVPVVVVVTACEEVDPMDTWWVENKEKFEGAGMMFHGHACVCAYRGRKNNQGLYLNNDLCIESRGKVVRLIHTRCLPTGWSKSSHVWFQQIFKVFLNMLDKTKIPATTESLYQRLAQSHSSEQTSQVIRAIEKAA